MITGINESKTLTRKFHTNVNVNLMKQNASQINGGITLNVDVSVKKLMCVKKIMLRILLHVIVNMDKIYQVLWIKLFVMKL